MTENKCCDCKGHCNKKGYPSVTKNSLYCENQRGVLPIIKRDYWIKLLNQLNSLFSIKKKRNR